ncbi:insulinase family protein [Niabella pedocola]|uniref:Insulinase family protein n=1 Tax=Niabella pedocola TaxID=1752077 RepID=A0ABS8PNP9_9BACT|nr:pitrilysin family protein [Niabella pedocola]MCD2422720.1 insulinase family protein [Niabella pedocola]
MKQLFLLLATICCTHLSYSQARLMEKVTAKDNDVVIPFSRYQLPNGLTLIVHEDHSDPLVHVDVTYHVGSAREEIGKSGFAHFFEHMMFQGSDNVADEQHFKIITEAGGTLNGTTNRDRTNYFETVPKNQLEKMLWLEADRMGFLLDAVTQQKFEVQRATVKNERGQNYDNQPYGLVFENSSKNLYPYGHPYSWLTIGYIEDLNRGNVNDLKNFFLRWYGPNNAVLTVGGDVAAADVVKMVEKYFGSIPAGPAVKNMGPMVPALDKDRYVTMVDQYAKLPRLQIVYPAPEMYTKEEAALDCLAEIIGQGNNSLLYQKLVKTQQALGAGAYNMGSELSSEFTISLTPAKGKSLKEMDAAVKQVFADFEQRGVTQADVDKFKSGIESQTIYGLESVSGKVSRLAAFYTFTGNANFITRYLENYRSITPQAVMDAYNKYIKGKGSVRLSVATKDDPDNIAGNSKYEIDKSGYSAPDYGYAGLTYTKAKDNFDRSKMPPAGNDLAVAAPAFWKEKKNGIHYIGSPLKEIPVVNIMIGIKGGRLAEPAEKSGLAALFAALMNEDTKTRSAEDFSKELDLLGSSISVSAATDATNIVVRSLEKNLDQTLALLEERILQPKFTEAAFNRIRNQYMEGYKNNLTRPASVATSVYNKLLFGNSAFGRNTSGTDQTLAGITLADVENFYAHCFSAADAEVIVIGDLSKQEIENKTAFLAKLPKTAPAIKQLPDFKPGPAVNGKPILYIVDFPKSAQTEFRIGNRTGMRFDGTGDYYKSGIMNYPLGGVFNSRLNLYLREDKGWTYGAGAYFSGSKYTGSYTFYSGIKAAATDSALHDVLRIITEYRDKGATQEELDFTKSAKLQSEARKYETGYQKAYYLSDILEYNLPDDIAVKQTGILKNFKREELNRLAKTKLSDPRNLVILLVGDQTLLSAKTREQFQVVLLDKEGNPVQQ